MHLFVSFWVSALVFFIPFASSHMRTLPLKFVTRTADAPGHVPLWRNRCRKFPKESRGGSRPKFWKEPLHIKHLYSYYILSYNHFMYVCIHIYIYMHVIWSHLQTSNMYPIVEYVQWILQKKIEPISNGQRSQIVQGRLGIVVRHLRQLFIHPLTGKVHGHEVNRIGQVGNGCHLRSPGSPEPGGWTRWEPGGSVVWSHVVARIYPCRMDYTWSNLKQVVQALSISDCAKFGKAKLEPLQFTEPQASAPAYCS